MRHDYALRRILELAAVAGALMALVTALAAPVVVHLLGGASFAPSIPVLRIQSIALAVNFVGTAAGYGLLSAGRLRSIMLANAFGLTVIVALGIVLASTFGAKGAAIATAAAEVLLTFALLGALLRGQPGLAAAARILPPLALACAVGAIPGVLRPAEHRAGDHRGPRLRRRPRRTRALPARGARDTRDSAARLTDPMSTRRDLRLATSLVGRYTDAVVPLAALTTGLRELPAVLRERIRYQRLSGGELAAVDDYPQLHDRTSTSPYDAHYTYQDAWAARTIHALAPPEHVDVGSRITFVLGLAAFVPVTFIDLRPLTVDVPNLRARAGSLLSLPYEDQSVLSLSSLHVIEHVGLGRYGDELDPDGTRKAARELGRVLAVGGQLLIGVPVGRPRTAFNAHRVLDPEQVVELFRPLEGWPASRRRRRRPLSRRASAGRPRRGTLVVRPVPLHAAGVATRFANAIVPSGRNGVRAPASIAQVS